MQQSFILFLNTPSTYRKFLSIDRISTKHITAPTARSLNPPCTMFVAELKFLSCSVPKVEVFLFFVSITSAPTQLTREKFFFDNTGTSAFVRRKVYVNKYKNRFKRHNRGMIKYILNTGLRDLIPFVF